MRVLSSRFKPGLTVVFRLCLCLLAAGVIIFLGTDGSTAATSSGSPPDIRVFSAEPITLKDGESALYRFEVWNATSLQLNEAGDVIKMISSLPSTTLKGTVKGRTANQIRTSTADSFDAILVATNAGGKSMKRVTIKFARVIQATTLTTASGQMGNTDNRTPKWGPQGAPASPLTSSGPSRSGTEPNFYKCPDNCKYCLTPDDAAGRGFTQRCSEKPCYYSPDNQQKWFCYSKPATVWCCRDGKVGEMTKEQCAQYGGSYYATQQEAEKACQAVVGWYCSGGTVYSGTPAQASAAGAVWYTTQAAAARNCDPTGWCCRTGKYAQTTRSQCAELGGSWYLTQAEAINACQAVNGYFCYGGKVYEGTRSQAAQVGATWYTSYAEAARVCQQAVMGWYCYSGKVFQGTQAQAAQMGVSWYTTQAAAASACQQTTCWCCAGGKIFQTTTAACIRAKGTCYANQSQAAAGCRIYLK